MTRASLETLVGALVVSAVIAFIALSASGSSGSGESGYRVSASFGAVGALKPGAEVRMAGVTVGRVDDLSLEPQSFRAVADLLIVPGVEIPEDSSAKILADGLLGDSYLSIEIGGAEAMLADGAAFGFTQDAIDVIDLVSRLLSSGVQREIEQQAR